MGKSPFDRIRPTTPPIFFDVLPIPMTVVYQQGNLILRKVDEIPRDAVPVSVEPLPDGRISLADGHFFIPTDKE